MIKNIIFDIGGVLVDFNPGRVLREMGLPEEEVQEIEKNTARSSTWKELDRGVMPKEEVFEKLILQVPEQYRADARKFLYEETLKTVTSYEYSAEWVKSLKDRGYKIYLLTNYPEWLFEAHFKEVFTFAKYVDGQVVSGTVKLIKPDPAIYKTILEKYSLVPEECVFIDDLPQNAQGARDAGINAIQFTNIDEVKAKLNSLLN